MIEFTQGNGCPDHYSPLNDEMCAKLEAYQSSFEDAKTKCLNEGAELLTITSQKIMVMLCENSS